MISFIAALDKNFVIGNKNGLPWGKPIPADIKVFREKTLGKTVVMGRKTFESIGKPLPNRTNVILTSDKTFTAEGCTMVYSLDEVKKLSTPDNEIMIIGGAQVFKEMLPFADRLYLTFVDGTFEGDVYFPIFNQSQWEKKEESKHLKDEKNLWDLSFVTYEKKRA